MTAGTVDTIAKLQTLAAGVTGIVTAPTTKYPVALDTASLPAVLTYAGSATTRAITLSPLHRRMDRTYYMACYIEALGQNTSNQRIQNSMALLQRFLDMLITNRNLADGVRVVGEVRDSGIISGADLIAGNAGYLVYNSQAYTGFVLEISVVEVNRA